MPDDPAGEEETEPKQEAVATKARILEAAGTLFAEKGLKGTTTRDIGESAGVNMALIHYHWGSKEELWSAVFFDVYSRFLQFVWGFLPGLAGMEPLDALREITRNIVDFMADNPNAVMLSQRGLPDNVRLPDPVTASFPFEILVDYMENNTNINFDPVDIRMAVYCIIGAFELFFTRPDLIEHYFHEDPDNMSPEFRERVAEALFIMGTRFGQVG